MRPLRRRTPLTLVHYASVLIVVCVVALLVALSAASPPLVTTALASSALKDKLRQETPLGAGLEIRRHGSLGGAETIAHAMRAADARAAEVARISARLRYVGAPVTTMLSLPVVARSPADIASGEQIAVRLMSRPAALANVEVVRQVPGPGLWLASFAAKQLRVFPGGRLVLEASSAAGRLRRVSVRVKGVYRALVYAPESPFWVNFHDDIYTLDPDLPPLPPFAFTTRAEIVRVGHLLGGLRIDDVYEIPVDARHITLAGARRLARDLDSIRLQVGDAASPVARALGCPSTYPISCVTSSSLSSAVTLADADRSAVAPMVTLLAGAGSGITLAAAAAAGLFLVRRRRGEASLLYGRGMPATVFAGRTVVEAALPSAVGGAAGFWLALVLARLLEPGGTIDRHTWLMGAARSAVGAVATVAMLGAAVAFAFRRLFDTGTRSSGWVRWLPWELPLLGVAIFLLLRIRSSGGVAESGGSAGRHPTLAVFLSPLLLTAATAGLTSRLGRTALRRRSHRGRTLSPTIFLALRRLAAARGLVVALTVVTAIALGAFFYAETLSASLRETALEKAYIGTGSDVQGTIEDSQPLPRGFPFPIARVQLANQTATVGGPFGRQVDVLLVEPRSVASVLQWQGHWGPSPRPLLARLADASRRPLPVIVTSDIARTSAVYVSGRRFPVRVLGVVKAFPGMSVGIPLVVVPTRALNDALSHAGDADALGVLWTYVWAKGPPSAVARALASSPLHPDYLTTIETFQKSPDVVLATRTFAFLRASAIGAGALVLIALLLYLQARQRSQTIASALARRMGMSRTAEILSICVELAAILAFALVVGGAVAIVSARAISRHLDPLPQYAPGPVFSLPIGAVAVASASLVAAMLAAAALASWLATRADMAKALRVG